VADQVTVTVGIPVVEYSPHRSVRALRRVLLSHPAAVEEGRPWVRGWLRVLRVILPICAGVDQRVVTSSLSSTDEERSP